MRVFCKENSLFSTLILAQFSATTWTFAEIAGIHTQEAIPVSSCLTDYNDDSDLTRK